MQNDYDNVIICITGMPGSGKTEAAKVFAERGFAVMEMKDEFMRLMKLVGRAPEGRESWKAAAELKAKKGMGVIANGMVDRIDPHSNTVIAGLRNSEELAVFRKRFGKGLFVIEMVAPERMRYQRLSKRGNKNDPKSYDWFLEREKNDLVDLGQKSLQGLADIKIENTGSLDELRRKIGEFLEYTKSI